MREAIFTYSSSHSGIRFDFDRGIFFSQTSKSEADQLNTPYFIRLTDLRAIFDLLNISFETAELSTLSCLLVLSKLKYIQEIHNVAFSFYSKSNWNFTKKVKHKNTKHHLLGVYSKKWTITENLRIKTKNFVYVTWLTTNFHFSCVSLVIRVGETCWILRELWSQKDDVFDYIWLAYNYSNQVCIVSLSYQNIV